MELLNNMNSFLHSWNLISRSKALQGIWCRFRSSQQQFSTKWYWSHWSLWCRMSSDIVMGVLLLVCLYLNWNTNTFILQHCWPECLDYFPGVCLFLSVPACSCLLLSAPVCSAPLLAMSWLYYPSLVIIRVWGPALYLLPPQIFPSKYTNCYWDLIPAGRNNNNVVPLWRHYIWPGRSTCHYNQC